MRYLTPMGMPPETKLVTSFSYSERRIRLILDTLQFNAEAGQSAFDRLSRSFETAYDQRLAGAGINISHEQLSCLFSDAWTIIRCCHSIFNIFRKEKSINVRIPDIDIARGEIVTKARNEMDHVLDNIGNYANLTAHPRPPLLGFLTVCFVPKCKHGSLIKELHGVALSHSDFHHTINLKVFPNEEELFPITGWISHVRLHAFGYIIDLSQLTDFVRRFQSALSSASSVPRQERMNLIISMRCQAEFTANWE